MKTLCRVFLLAAICLALTGIENLANASSPASEFTQVDAYLAETMRRLPIKGAALAIVRGDEIIYMQGYGTANSQGDPATPQTPWLMGSVTKSFTALAARQLAQAGKLDLDAAVQTYLPEFRLADPQAAASITVRNLLNHTSGISNVEGDQPYMHSPQSTYEQVLSNLAHYQPAEPPGAKYEYSNLNYVLLGQVIASVSGQTYVDYVERNILAPLNMSYSTFEDYHGLPRAASGNLIAYGIPVPYDEAHVPVMNGASNLTATAEDMAHYLSAFFGKGQYNGHSILSASGQGWFDPWWNWMDGRPEADVVYGFSGGKNSISTSCLLYPRQEVGVVLLLNTRLDQLSPAITAYDIATGIGNIITGNPSEIPSNRGFYLSWALVDGILILLIASLIWQISRLKSPRSQDLAARQRPLALAWVGSGIDLLICSGILVLPALIHTRWNSLITLRPDFGLPLALIAGGFGLSGIIRIAYQLAPRQGRTPAIAGGDHTNLERI